MKTIGALLASIINMVALINVVIDVATKSTTNVGDAVVDASLMVKAGVNTAKVSFDMENAKTLQLLEAELNAQTPQSTDKST